MTKPHDLSLSYNFESMVCNVKKMVNIFQNYWHFFKVAVTVDNKKYINLIFITFRIYRVYILKTRKYI